MYNRYFQIPVSQSSSEFSGNLFYGNSFKFGNIEKCLKTSHESTDENLKPLKGKLCFIQFFPSSRSLISTPPLKSYVNVEWQKMDTRAAGTLCVPASCNATVVMKLMTRIFIGTNLTIAKDYNQEKVCKSYETTNYSLGLTDMLMALVSILHLSVLNLNIFDL